MSLQDDIFDVRDALKRKPEKAGFDRIVEALSYYEQSYDQAAKTLSDIKAGARAIRSLLKEKK